MLKFPKMCSFSMALQLTPYSNQLHMCPDLRSKTTSSTFVPLISQLAQTQSSSHHHNRTSSSTS
ncbi:UNVERIFIED_CONTAM: hypothetical protein GTU68_061343 [Idotea baltica]|nr:hypothetical protein [Idotea baltica]